jgi:NAD(P)H-dependent flavin oxidoreductase YrpB (nitropropane dioxygenase family)
MKVINLTPHEVKLMDDDGNVVASLPSEGVARARQTDEVVGEVEIEGFTVPVVKTTFGEPEDLPEPTEGVVYVVSVVTANAARAIGRTTDDLLITSGPVRDADGRIIGCRQLAHI